MDFNDPYIKAISRTALAFLALFLLVVAVLGLATFVDWRQTDSRGPGSEELASIVGYLPALSGTKMREVSSMIAILLAALPLAVTTVCFRNVGATRHLNGFGRVLATIFLLTVFIGGAAYLLLDPVWGDNHRLGTDGLTILHAWCRAALQGGVTYVAALLGMKAS